MVYSGIQTFMEKLKQLIMNENHIPFINHPEIIRQRPQFQRLYDELHNPIIQTLFIDQRQDLEKVKDLKKRFIDAAEEAQYIVDLFLSAVHTVYNNDFNRPLMDVMRSFHSVKVELINMKMDSPERTVNQRLEKVNDLKKTFIDVAEEAMNIVNLFLSAVNVGDNELFTTSDEDFKHSLNIDDVMRSFESIKVELMSMRIHMASSPTTERKPSQSASFTRNSKVSKKLMDEIVVGLDDDLALIRDKLVEDQKKLDVVSIVGMGGIGKTTLTTKVHTDPFNSEQQLHPLTAKNLD